MREIYNTFATPVYRLCQRMVRDRQTALDLRQEIFLKILRNLDSFKGESSLRTWILRIATNHCLDHLRLKRRTAIFVAEEEIPYHAEPSVPDETQKIITQEEISHLLKFCLPMTRQMAQLYFVEGLNHREISGILGVHRNIVARRIQQFTEQARNYSPVLGKSIS
ncbi:MAG TPA: RNA polymerase sigma factor [Fibrobacteraceae bacterium]|nr:RNA polymerase sigma factor [Fibrobacteraceae bacterium]